MALQGTTQWNYALFTHLDATACVTHRCADYHINGEVQGGKSATDACTNAGCLFRAGKTGVTNNINVIVDQPSMGSGGPAVEVKRICQPDWHELHTTPQSSPAACWYTECQHEANYNNVISKLAVEVGKLKK